MKIPIFEVEKIATLSRLSFSDDEKIMYQHNLEDVLMAAEKLDEIDTDNIQPTAHIQGIQNVLREDIIVPSMPVDLLTQGAPEAEDGCFIVPKVVE